MLSRQTRIRRVANANFANDFSFLNPELLARESILRLKPRMLLSRLIKKDFSPTPALFGDVVQIKRPGTFNFGRKDQICDPISKQDATGDRISVRLDQWPQVTFQICDGEENRPFVDLVEEYLNPALDALAEGVDRIVMTQVHRFYGGDVAGHLGLVSTSNVFSYLLEAREKLSANSAPEKGRIALLTSHTETTGLSTDLFNRVDASGSDDALRRADLGEIAGFHLFQPSAAPSITASQTQITALANGAAAVGATSLIYDTASADIVAGTWLVVAGDETPQHVTADSGGTNVAGTLTLSPGLRRAVADNAAITIVKQGAVNFAAGYRGRDTNTNKPGWAKEIVIDGFLVAPQIGQGVSFGTQTDVYGVIGVNGLVGITLDRPLETAITDNMTVNLMPAGEYNMALLPEGLLLMVRPLAAPRPGSGASSKTINFGGLSVRVTVGYDIDIQAHIIVLDFLAGINILNEDLVVPMYG